MDNISLMIERIDRNILELVLVDSFVDYCFNNESGFELLSNVIKDEKHINDLINESQYYIIKNLQLYNNLLYEATFKEGFSKIRSGVGDIGKSTSSLFRSNITSPARAGFAAMKNQISSQRPEKTSTLDLKKNISDIGSRAVTAGKNLKEVGSEAFGKMKSVAGTAAHHAFKKIEDSKYGQRIIDPILAGFVAAKRRRAFETNYNKPVFGWYPKHKEWEKEFGEKHRRLKDLINKPVY